MSRKTLNNWNFYIFGEIYSSIIEFEISKKIVFYLTNHIEHLDRHIRLLEISVQVHRSEGIKIPDLDLDYLKLRKLSLGIIRYQKLSLITFWASYFFMPFLNWAATLLSIYRHDKTVEKSHILQNTRKNFKNCLSKIRKRMFKNLLSKVSSWKNYWLSFSTKRNT